MRNENVSVELYNNAKNSRSAHILKLKIKILEIYNRRYQ